MTMLAFVPDMALCPSCQRELPRPGNPDTFPFCSPRCRTINLGNWLGERYRLESAERDSDDPYESIGRDGEPPEV